MIFDAWKRVWVWVLACAVGVPCAAAPEPREWVLGQSSPLSGPFGPMGQDYRNGALLAFDDVNRHGGVQGRPIRLVSLDDGYQVDKAIANAHALLDEHKVLCFFNHAGSSTVLATIPIAAAAGVAYVGPYTGHADLYRGTWPQLFVTRASFADEFDKIFDYLATIGYRRIALVTYDNRIGEEQRRDVDAGLRQRGRQLMVHATMALGGSAQAAVARIAAQSPDALLLNVSGLDAVAFVRAMAQTGAKPIYFGRSLLGSNLLADQLGPLASGVVVSQLVPSPFKPKSNIAREYLRLKARNPDARPSFGEFEGFLNAKLMIVALGRMGTPATREGLLNVLNNLGRVDLGGYTVDFSNGKHVGSRYVELTMLRGDGSFAH